MKVLGLYFILVSSLYAHDIDVARNCYLDHLKIETSQMAVKSCTNVASSCYECFRRHEGMQDARDICFNVSANCFGEYNMKFNRQTSRDECLNVNNKCYITHRKHGVGVYESRNYCLDYSL